jgi:hypothetical protein
MISAVLCFAILTALFEGLLVYKFCPNKWLGTMKFAVFCHLVMFLVNLVVHWGTVTGTMTAVTAALVSFAVLPIVRWVKTFKAEYETCSA